MKINERLKKLITTYDGQDIDLCYYVFENLNDVYERESAIGLKFFFEEIKNNVTDKTLKLESKVSQEELNQYHKMYGKYINELLNVFVKKAHLNAWVMSDFYDALWKTLKKDSLLEDAKSCAFAILCFAQSPLLPYVELDKPVKMDKDKFTALIREQKQPIQKVRHILGLGLSQKTEVSSLILQELLKVEDREKQIVFLAVIFDEVAKEKLKGLQGIIQEIKVEDKAV